MALNKVMDQATLKKLKIIHTIVWQCHLVLLPSFGLVDVQYMDYDGTINSLSFLDPQIHYKINSL